MLRWRLVRTRRQRSWCPFALRCAHAHKGPELGNVVRTQGRNQAVVCGVVLRNPSLVCVTGYCAHREYPAPSGALRLADHERPCGGARHQGAPSTIRCIETTPRPVRLVRICSVREHPAPSGALRYARMLRVDRCGVPRQGASSTIRCICALAPEEQVVVLCPSARGAEADRHRDGAACGYAVSAPGVSFCREVRTQGRNQAVVCGVVLRYSVPCVRNRELRAKGALSAIGCIEAGP